MLENVAIKVQDGLITLLNAVKDLSSR